MNKIGRGPLDGATYQIVRLYHLDGEERANCFALFAFLVSRYCCVALPHDATGLSAVCDCGIPDHTHLLFSSVCGFRKEYFYVHCKSYILY